MLNITLIDKTPLSNQLAGLIMVTDEENVWLLLQLWHNVDTLHTVTTQLSTSAANRLIGEVVQSRRRPLLGPSSAFTFKTLLRHYAKRALTPR